MPLFLLQAARRRFALGGPVAVPLESACHLRPFVVSELPQQASPATGVYTWKPRDSIWATLIKAPGPDTIVVLHADDAQHLHPHRMAPECALPQSCPPGTCLLGQVVADPGASTTTVSILLFDILQVGRGIDVAKLGAKERYRILREEFGSYAAAGSGVSVQWAGDRGPAEAFCAPGGGVPHEIDYIFMLSEGGDPLSIGRVPGAR